MSEKPSSKKRYWLIVPLAFLKAIRLLLGCLFNRYSMTVVVALFLLDVWCEWRGVPEFVNSAVLRMIASRKLPVKFGWIQAGVFHGVVLSDVTLGVDSPVGPVEIHASSVDVSLDWSALFEGEVLPHAFRVHGATVQCKDEAGKYVVNVSETELACSIEGDGSLSVSLVGDCSGMSFDVDMRLRHGRDGLRNVFKRPVGTETALNTSLQAWLVRFHESLSEVISRGGGSRVRMTVSGDCFHPEEWAYNGYMNIQEAYFRNLGVTHGSLSFSGTFAKLKVRNIRLAVGTSNAIQGEFVLYGADREFEATLTSHVEARLLDSLLVFLSHSGAAVRTEVRQGLLTGLERPMDITLEVQRCPMDLKELSAKIDCSLAAANVPMLGRCRGDVELSYQDGVVSIDTMDLVLQRSSSEKISLTGTWNLERRELDLSLTGDVDIRTSLSAAGARLPEALLRFGEGVSNLKVACKIPLDDLSNATMTGSLTASDVSVLGTVCETMTCNADYSPGTHASLTLRGVRAGGYEVLSMETTLDSARWLDTQELHVGIRSLSLHGTRPGEPISETGEALSCTGNMVWKAPAGSFSFTLDGRCYPGRLYHSYLQQYDFDKSEMLKHIDCSGNGEAMRFSLSLPEAKSRSKSWELQGSLSFGKMRFNGYSFNSLQCDRFLFTPTGCEFNDIRVESARGDVGELDLRVDYAPNVHLTFSRVKIEGDPRLVGVFFVFVPVRDAYMRVFNGIQWKAGKRPIIRIPQLVYYCGKSWRVVSEGIYVHSPRMSYSQLEVDEVNAIVELDLPHRVVMERVLVAKNNWRVAGSVNLRLGDAPQCDFRIYKTLYGIDLSSLLKGLLPDKANLLSELSVSNDCLVDCTGSVFLSGKPRLHMQGGLHAKYIKYGDWQLDDVVSRWTYDDGDIRWHIEKSALLDGEFRSSGNYDIEHDQGHFLLRFDGISLDKATKTFGDKHSDKATYTGKVNGELQLSLLRGWAGRDWHLNGNGRVAIREGELWNVPVLSSLGNLVSSASFGLFSNGLGQISELDAEFELLGERVRLSRMTTNGTIVSLDGVGSYTWKDTWKQGQLKLLVNGVPVKGIKILSFMLTPLTGMFQAELSGTLDKNSWKMRTFMDKLF